MVTVRACLTGLFALAAAVAGAAPGPEGMNALLGVPLWSDTSLWDDEASGVATRLRLPEQSRTARDSSYRAYPSASARIAGARPRSIALYAGPSSPEELSVVFSNKGDSLEFVVRSSDLRALQKQIRDEARQLADEFRSVLGEPVRDQVGEPGATRESVLRWNWEGHALLLSAPREEYVLLRIVPQARADGERAPRVPDSDLRKELRSRVESRPNGDVVIGSIPMVDQGPKGYCVPATWERVMRYVGIPADMSVLAMAGETRAGGGTTIDGIVKGAGRSIRAHGRRLAEQQGKPTLAAVKRHIDDGVPVIWPMFSGDAFNLRAEIRREARAAMTDPEAWKQELRKQERALGRLRADVSAAHVCLIIGYNRLTGELAVSDSWGPEFAERWVTEEEALQVSQGGYLVITW
jgi:hypothetical protein